MRYTARDDCRIEIKVAPYTYLKYAVVIKDKNEKEIIKKAAKYIQRKVEILRDIRDIQPNQVLLMLAMDLACGAIKKERKQNEM